MNQYFLKKECKELHAFPHVIEFASKKISTIQFGSLKKETADFFRFYYVIEGRFDWVMEEKHYVLYPGDLAVILPGQSFGGEKDLLDIGTISWLHLKLDQSERNNKIGMGSCSRLADQECRPIAKILTLNNCPILSEIKEVGQLFQNMQSEFVNQEIGYTARINQLIDELFIIVGRHLTRQNN